jgi:hypothetical protein
MALCRCLEKHSQPKGRKNLYICYVKPVGHPNSGLICGNCDNPGVIWLTKDEAQLYDKGQRIFEGPNQFVRMRANDSGLNTSRIL